jgi:hypothetical protein
MVGIAGLLAMASYKKILLFFIAVRLPYYRTNLCFICQIVRIQVTKVLFDIHFLGIARGKFYRICLNR